MMIVIVIALVCLKSDFVQLFLSSDSGVHSDRLISFESDFIYGM
jgi:hypothetical protein